MASRSARTDIEQAGMGVGIGDYNLDGILDLFKTHFADDTNVLYRSDAQGQLRGRHQRGGPRRRNEVRRLGRGDRRSGQRRDSRLFLVTGNVYPEIERQLPGYPLKTPRVVFRNLGDGTFEELIEEAGPGLLRRTPAAGCAFGDFDNDGDIDVLIVNLNEPPSLLRNDLTGDAALAQGAAWWARLEPQRSRRACDRALRGTDPGAGGGEPVGVLLGERPPPPFRPWQRPRTRTWRSAGPAVRCRSCRTSPRTRCW